MDKVTYVGNADVNAIEYLYQSYLKDPQSVDIGWQKFFEGFEFARTNYEDNGEIPENFQKEYKVLKLIHGYRSRGHLFTKTNPVRDRRTYEPSLDIANFGLSDADLDSVYQAGDLLGIGAASLREILNCLEQTYCQSIGFQYTYAREPQVIEWLNNRIELKNRITFSKEDKKQIFNKLQQASNFEAFLGKKFVGQKRFSIEGGEALIPALDKLVQKGAELGVEYFVMGMAHRGRLNTLANIFEKKPQNIFCEFEGKEFDALEGFDGDVKYHLGYTNHIKTKEGKTAHLTLAANPSHLEAVAPVVHGIARAKLDQEYQNENQVCPIIIHGDAAIAGQGIVYETVQMSMLKGYRVGGTVHIVVNNQVGFTTNYLDARSSTYCTDVAKITLSPVFHVNGDDIEAVIQAMDIAMEYRQKFHTDVYIDLLCYRKYGHNEGDEPKFTQPNLYNLIAKHPNPKDIYLKQLLAEGAISTDEAKKLEDAYLDFLEKEFAVSQKDEKAIVWDFLSDAWKGFRHGTAKDFEKSPETGVKSAKLDELSKKVATLPEGKKYFRKIQKIFDDRLESYKTNRLDWGAAEILAYATLLDEGHPIRFSGQDVERGTFSHRHAVVITEDTEERVITLNELNAKQAKISIYNSLLSEYGVLGFEYGYSLATPQTLTIWEAQFGDFYNGAQIMVDQFIIPGEDKWSTQSGLVMLLPHGYEGQGAEHSSGRMERFLQQCADNNIQIVNTSTPANHFHLLRRQINRPFRKPLIVFSPKQILRHPDATSSMAELAKGSFQEVIDDPKAKAGNVDTVIFCSGKIYYELSAKAEEMGATNMAFVRIEQLYPIPEKQITDVLAKYKAKNTLWVQEEPANMGAWSFIAMNLSHLGFKGICRPAAGAAAEGSKKLHEKRLKRLFDDVFAYASTKTKK